MVERLRFRKLLKISVVLGVITAFQGCAKLNETPVQNQFAAPGDTQPFARDQYFVKFKKQGATIRSFNSVRSKIHQLVDFGTRIDVVSGDLYEVEFPKDANVNQSLSAMTQDSEIEYIEPIPKAYAIGVPNDPKFNEQWAHQVVNSIGAWEIEKGNQNVVVGVIDTGIDYQHEDLKDNMWINPGEIAGNRIDDDGNGYIDDIHGYDFVNRDSDPMSDDFPSHHGTHVAGTVGALSDNRAGGAGQAPQVKLMALKFLGANGSGDYADAIRAIDYAIRMKVKILNNSWGGSQYSRALEEAIIRAKQAGIVFVVAAGNGGNDGIGDNNDQVPTYPSNYRVDNILSVAATTSRDQLTSFSNYGPRTVHVAAPGASILSTSRGNAYQYLSGTSMASPLVAGIAALVHSLEPNLGYRQIIDAIVKGSDQIRSLQGRVRANGRVNAKKTLEVVKGVTPTPDPDPDPAPIPDPTPGPGPIPAPVGDIAPTPKLMGQEVFNTSQPNIMIPLSWDLRAFPKAYGVYIEVSRPNQGFLVPNGQEPDPNKFTSTILVGKIGQIVVFPVRDLPGWGTYQIRVIPLDASGNNPVGRFSNSAILNLRRF